MAIMSQRKTLESALEHTRGYREMEARDRAFARAILATTFRRHGQTLAVLSKLLAKPLEETPEPAVALLVTGATQLLWMDGAPHAVVSTTVALAEENKAAFGLKGLINAVLRKVDKEGRDLAARTAPRDNLPDWMARAWRKAYGPGALARMTNVLMDPPPLDITVKDPAEREKWAEALHADILPTGTLRRREIGDVTQLPGYRDGTWWVQDAAAAIPATLLGVKERDHVLDMCAAPGGKTLQLSAKLSSPPSDQRSIALHCHKSAAGCINRPKNYDKNRKVIEERETVQKTVFGKNPILKSKIMRNEEKT